jgi:hypothetical protein
MEQDTLLPFDLPAVCRKKVSVGFDGGLLSSDGGVLLLRGVERRLGIAERLSGCMVDRRDPSRIDHALVEMLRLRMFLIAAGYEDADDCDSLRADPAFKLAVGRLPETGAPLCSQPTMSRLENAPSRIELARMMGAMVDLFCASWAKPPAAPGLPESPRPAEVFGIAGGEPGCQDRQNCEVSGWPPRAGPGLAALSSGRAKAHGAPAGELGNHCGADHDRGKMQRRLGRDAHAGRRIRSSPVEAAERCVASRMPGSLRKAAAAEVM